MLTPDYLKMLPNEIIKIFEDVEDYIINDISRRIGKMGTATRTAEIQKIALEALTDGIGGIDKRIADALGVAEEEVKKIFAESLEVATDSQADIARAVGVKLDTGFARQLGEAAVKSAMGDLTNLTRTAGYVMNNGQFTLWTDAYRQALSFAQMQVATGATNYNTAMRQTMKPFTNRGLTKIGFESGRTMSIEAAVRQCVLGGVKDMAREAMKQNAEDIGTDGWEISAHAACAADHEPYQGRQYSNEDYDALNGILARPIGTLNCRHTAFPVMLGISEPTYSEKQLQDMRKANENGVDYEGKHYTLYKAEQMQRRLERSIRKCKRELIDADGRNDSNEFTAKSIRLRRLRDYYADFSDKAGLISRSDMLQVSGYGRGIARKAVIAEKEFTLTKENGIINISTGGVKSYLSKLKKHGGAHGYQEDAAKTNPNYAMNDVRWTHNCQRCVPTYEMRRRGYDVTAQPRMLDSSGRPSRNDVLAYQWYLPYKDGGKLVQTVRADAAEIAKQMQTWGDGARAEIAIRWKKSRGGGGHVFAVEQVNGQTVFLDPQSGEFGVHYCLNEAMGGIVEVLRTDNIEFTNYIKKCCR